MIYRLGDLITGNHGYMMEWPRWLLDEDGTAVAVVDSCAGPASVGDLTEDDIEAAYPDRVPVEG